MAEEEALRRLANRTTLPSLEARRAKAVILRAAGEAPQDIATKLNTSAAVLMRWISRFEAGRLDGVRARKAIHYRKADDGEVKGRVFALLHSPPAAKGINRASWRLRDLKLCLKEEGLVVSEELISRIIRYAGYRWKKARTRRQ